MTNPTPPTPQHASPRHQTPPRPHRRIDTLSLVVGLLGLFLALSVLWSEVAGPINTELLDFLIPLSLVLVGGIGLVAGRGRN